MTSRQHRRRCRLCSRRCTSYGGREGRDHTRGGAGRGARIRRDDDAVARRGWGRGGCPGGDRDRETTAWDRRGHMVECPYRLACSRIRPPVSSSRVSQLPPESGEAFRRPEGGVCRKFDFTVPRGMPQDAGERGQSAGDNDDPRRRDLVPGRPSLSTSPQRGGSELTS
jgi:hypothetical protein